MNTIKSRFERFAAFAFSSSSTFEKGAELWDVLSHYEFYLEGEPSEIFLEKMEELGCSRRWLLYASGEMFADNEKGKVLRYKFMQGIGISNKKFSFTDAVPGFISLQESAAQAAAPDENTTVKSERVKKKPTAGKPKKAVKKK